MYVLIVSVFYLNTMSIAVDHYPSSVSCEMARGVVERTLSTQGGNKGLVLAKCRIVN